MERLAVGEVYLFRVFLWVYCSLVVFHHLTVRGSFTGTQSIKVSWVGMEVSKYEVVVVVAGEGVRCPSVEGVERFDLSSAGFGV